MKPSTTSLSHLSLLLSETSGNVRSPCSASEGNLCCSKAVCFCSSIVLGSIGSDVSLENGELTERWWHKATDPRRIAELPRLKMNSVSDLGVCGYCVLLVRPSSDRGRLFLMEGVVKYLSNAKWPCIKATNCIGYDLRTMLH